MPYPVLENLTPYEEFVRSRVKWLPDTADDLMHAAVGLLGEVLEFENAKDSKHRLEELGDCWFYFTHMRLVMQTVGFQEELPRLASLPSAGDLLKAATQLHDIAKKVWVYKKLFPSVLLDIHMGMLKVSACCRFLIFPDNITVLENSNMTKLRKRYPNGYSDQAAQARADKPQGE